jgi:hypothetical protein
MQYAYQTFIEMVEILQKKVFRLNFPSDRNYLNAQISSDGRGEHVTICLSIYLSLFSLLPLGA